MLDLNSGMMLHSQVFDLVSLPCRLTVKALQAFPRVLRNVTVVYPGMKSG